MTRQVTQIGAAIRAAADSAGLTGKEIAEKVNCSPQMLSAVTRGRAEPSIRLLKKIAEACGKTLIISFAPLTNN